MVAFAAGCGDDDDGGGGGGALSEIGEPEGELNLLCWPGYCEDGSNDPKVDWIGEFEKEIGLPGQRRRSSERPTRRSS